MERNNNFLLFFIVSRNDKLKVTTFERYMLCFKAISLYIYIRAKFRNVTKIRNLALEHNVGM